jgi:hypothetical protein
MPAQAIQTHSSPRFSRQVPPAAVLTCALSALLLASCSSDDDDGGTPTPNTSTAFTSTLNRAQTVNNATLGAAIQVTVHNQAPLFGTFQTPVWLGIHDGSFDIYDSGVAASAALESLAEDGSAALLGTDFDAAAGTSTADLVLGTFGPADGPIAPNEVQSTVIRLDPSAAESRFLSWASMVIPSNDAFIANGDPMAHRIFSDTGVFEASTITVAGADVLDAGTEVNDEAPANTAFFGQAAPNTGTDENSVVGNHVGFVPGGNILMDAMFTGADFEVVDPYTVLVIDIADATADIAEPSGMAVASIDAVSGELNIDLAVSGLSGAATMLHLHRGSAGNTGDVEIDLMGLIDVNEGGTTTASGSVVIDDDQLALLRAGNMYFNLHTDMNPMGEVRGQVQANNASTAAMTTAANVTAPIAGETVTVTIQNAARDNGTFQTPVWLGFHDGSFDIYDLGSPASAELERIAEDGTAMPLGDALRTAVPGASALTLAGEIGPIRPGEVVSQSFRLDPDAATNSHLSWASMIIPSNDAFVANAGETDHELFSGGSFTGADFVSAAADARDAGTEVNDEDPTNTAFFGQMDPDTGTVEGANITVHPGYTPGGAILMDAMFTGADFANTPGYEFLRFSLSSSTPTLDPTGIASIRVSGNTATLTASAMNLSGDVTAVLLRDAAAGATGAIIEDLTTDIDTNADGSFGIVEGFSIDDAFRTALEAGTVYIELQTELNPDGELRGQITPPIEAL